VGTEERSFVLRHTRLQRVAALDEIRLHLSDDVYAVWRAVHEATGDPDAPIPYWAFAWGGGLAIARYLAEHPDRVRARQVIDFASGSGVCAIAAARAGAASVIAVDVDPFARAAIVLNARVNGVRLTTINDDMLEREPPDADVILAGDCWYDESFGTRTTEWLRRARERGTDVLIGDAGRRYLDHAGLSELATYEVRSTTDLEDLGRTTATVYTIAPAGVASEA
jgi:predicted nicotinamide N-methyase